MTFNVNEMRASLSRSGVLSPNKYSVNFTTPEVMRGFSINGMSTGDTERLITMRAVEARLPGIAIMTSDVNRYGVGPLQKMPFNVSFTETPITFAADRNGEIYRYFYQWFSSIFDFSGSATSGGSNTDASYQLEYKNSYTTDLYVTVYDAYGNAVSSVFMKKAFPVAFNEVPLSWNPQNDFVKFTVSFSFSDWTMSDVQSSSITSTSDTSIWQNTVG